MSGLNRMNPLLIKMLSVVLLTLALLFSPESGGVLDCGNAPRLRDTAVGARGQWRWTCGDHRRRDDGRAGDSYLGG